MLFEKMKDWNQTDFINHPFSITNPFPRPITPKNENFVERIVLQGPIKIIF